MKIGELAKRADCSVETIRFYEREGLLKAPVRDENGYRSYLDINLQQLNFIRHCRSLGMGLPDVRTLLDLQAHPDLACIEINHLIESQIARVHQQVKSLRILEKQLHALRKACQVNSTVANCAILRNLEQATEAEDCPCHSAREKN